MKLSFKTIFIAFFLLAFLPLSHQLEAQDPDQIKELVQEFKEDRRGPYLDIKWFCEDSTMREARDPCPDGVEGVQHARYKYQIIELAQRHHLFLDQILTGTSHFSFWDERNDNSRLIQYLLTEYISQQDHGWINQKGQYYRGAKQIEDEQEWGTEFIQWLVTNQQRTDENYLLVRDALRNLPSKSANDDLLQARILSKKLSEKAESFFDLRTKIHGRPDPSDLPETVKWLHQHCEQQPDEVLQTANELITELQKLYDKEKILDWDKVLRYLPPSSRMKEALSFSGKQYHNSYSHPLLQIEILARTLHDIRYYLPEIQWVDARIQLLQMSLQIEDEIVLRMEQTRMENLYESYSLTCQMEMALYGTGHLEYWELTRVKRRSPSTLSSELSYQQIRSYLDHLKQTLFWGSTRVESEYGEEVQRYINFEPLARTFLDHQIRSSILLPFSNAIVRLEEKVESKIEGNHTNQIRLKGLNSGVAHGIIQVIDHMDENQIFAEDRIYAFYTPPIDLPPVAGIINVTEGNPVSHVQLLARNLGIPNAQISHHDFNRLKYLDGKSVFYAISPLGTGKLILEEKMSSEERKLVDEKKMENKKIHIQTDKLNLTADTLLHLQSISSDYSGRWCGPKAANLGQLKKLFPNNVVEGIVIPFGVFKDHMQQEIPGINESYWHFLERIFLDEKRMIHQRVEAKERECIILQELKLLQEYIYDMPLKENLINQLEESFLSQFDQSLGQVPVFLRSDTNMEDLPNFSGAGLNLTLFNVVARELILNGIKKVWASPYSERSYRWRQRILENPQQVYPSILVIPSVNVDKSGVMITKNVKSNDRQAFTLSFSRGVGGAVEGQSAETYLLAEERKDDILIHPSRETRFRIIPPSGGSKFVRKSAGEPIVTYEDRNNLRKMGQQVQQKMSNVYSDTIPLDIELGIKDGDVWLFQVRPFVENKMSSTLNYLQKLDGQQPVVNYFIYENL